MTQRAARPAPPIVAHPAAGSKRADTTIGTVPGAAVPLCWAARRADDMGEGDRAMTAMGSGGYVVGWSARSLINAGLARGKGRNGLLWWLASLVPGSIGTLPIVMLPPVSARQP